MNFKHGYQAGRFVGEHYLDYLIGFQIGFWMGVPLAIMKQGQPARVCGSQWAQKPNERDRALRYSR